MPRSKAASKQVGLKIQLSEEEHQSLQEIAQTLQCSMAEVLRRGIGPMRQHAMALQAGVAGELTMAGDQAAVQAKARALEARRGLVGWALAAKHAGVTYKTLKFWLDTDPVFRELAEEAQAQGVDAAETWLVRKAKEGNVSAIFGVLNAKHPDYGMIRTQILNQVLNPLMARVAEVARRYIQPADLQRFASEVCALCEQVALSATSGRRKGG